VLINLGVVFHGATDDDTFGERLCDTARRLSEAVRAAAAAEPGCESTGACSYHHLNEPEINLTRCVACGGWTTDHSKPDQVAGVMSGSPLRGVFLCGPCRVAVSCGEMPAERLIALPFEEPGSHGQETSA